MAQVVWTEPALTDLDAIADYIALENPEAARALVQKVFRHVEQLARHPKSGPKPPELKGWRYRQIIEPPCRVFYREDGERVYILYVMRAERLLKPKQLTARARSVETTTTGSRGHPRLRRKRP
ncbi:type II toxin-antitoxin system RelE/ParE family toxin [Sinimarinibacterium flocculans]|uniref:Plasmid stabilization system protein ParE n=1 Tax=Sinimarinibacterium flocculans TaxID=985250 RepID=A0A318E7K1_9GAMM|nr:type II toxin-antitoxin system RelE/ParE family toxin [Sinimarinibacterium flocculans]PXV64626.1 plasmid stabilization system protein ParE [Sinimarinibacterium flocculans]